MQVTDPACSLLCMLCWNHSQSPQSSSLVVFSIALRSLHTRQAFVKCKQILNQVSMVEMEAVLRSSRSDGAIAVEGTWTCFSVIQLSLPVYHAHLARSSPTPFVDFFAILDKNTGLSQETLEGIWKEHQFEAQNLLVEKVVHQAAEEQTHEWSQGHSIDCTSLTLLATKPASRLRVAIINLR